MKVLVKGTNHTPHTTHADKVKTSGLPTASGSLDNCFWKDSGTCTLPNLENYCESKTSYELGCEKITWHKLPFFGGRKFHCFVSSKTWRVGWTNVLWIVRSWSDLIGLTMTDFKNWTISSICDKTDSKAGAGKCLRRLNPKNLKKNVFWRRNLGADDTLKNLPKNRIP